jgi:anti-sigma factor ChrR (cupin superfamily)
MTTYPTELYTDLSQRVVSLPSGATWYPSPEVGVTRRPLSRRGGEVAQATSLVRYAAGASFAEHTHHGGEELFVLEGVFSDEHGDYPAGTYLRNPPGSQHRPFSREGCLLFVKLQYFAPDDTDTVRLDTTHTQWQPGLVPGLSVLSLHEFDGVNTALVRWAPHTRFQPHIHPGGEEILVLEGVFRDEFGSYPAGTWIRSPRWSRHNPFTTEEGALIYVSVGHVV